jgi:hypothetical protein
MKKHLIKGSPEAKAHMTHLRNLRGYGNCSSRVEQEPRPHTTDPKALELLQRFDELCNQIEGMSYLQKSSFQYIDKFYELEHIRKQLKSSYNIELTKQPKLSTKVYDLNRGRYDILPKLF